MYAYSSIFNSEDLLAELIVTYGTSPEGKERERSEVEEVEMEVRREEV
jgi:hypothetical protein